MREKKVREGHGSSQGRERKKNYSAPLSPPFLIPSPLILSHRLLRPPLLILQHSPFGSQSSSSRRRPSDFRRRINQTIFSTNPDYRV